MIDLKSPVGVESLIDEISRDPSVVEVYVREETIWAWTEALPFDPDDAGIRYSRSTRLSAVSKVQPGRETQLATLRLENGDSVVAFELNELGRYDLVRVAAAALR